MARRCAVTFEPERPRERKSFEVRIFKAGFESDLGESLCDGLQRQSRTMNTDVGADCAHTTAYRPSGDAGKPSW